MRPLNPGRHLYPRGLRAACGQGRAPSRAWSAASSATLASWGTPLYSIAPTIPAPAEAVLLATLPLRLPAASAAPAAAHVASLLSSMPASCATAELPAMLPLCQPAAAAAPPPACRALAAASAALPPAHAGGLCAALDCFAPLPRLPLPLTLYPNPGLPDGGQARAGTVPGGSMAAGPGATPGKLSLAAAAARAVAAARAAGLQLLAPGEAGAFTTTGSPKSGPYPAREAECGRVWSDTLLCSPVGALPPVLPPTVTF